MMISPIITYIVVHVKLFLTETQRRKLSWFDDRAREIVGEELRLPQLYKLNEKIACETVRKCLEKDICVNFHEYFEINKQGRNTRDSGILMKLPKVKLEFGKCASFVLQQQKFLTSCQKKFELKRIINYSDWH